MAKTKEKGLYTELKKAPIKEGGLRGQLGLKKDEKFNKTELQKALKTEVGKTFNFRGKQKKMTELMRKRIQLAVNMMK